MAKNEVNRRLDVRLPHTTYPLLFGSGLLSDSSIIREYVTGSQVLIVSNDTVAPLYLARIQNALADIQTHVVLLPDGEAYKNQASLTTIYDMLLEHQHHRDTTLIALGGGVIGDITGFAASTYQRGVRWIQCPTTLLAMVDASVGGKTAINHPIGKNMIGSFYQPNAVIMDLSTLSTLPPREMKAGMAEVIKHGLLVGGDFLSLLNHVLKSTRGIQLQDLEEFIIRSCELKAAIVEEDEFDRGRRALLNLGHTFAHALEALTHYQQWLHGEAVAIGLYCAALLSQHLGHLTQDDVRMVDNLLRQAGLPRRIPRSIDLIEMIRLMGQDKKIKDNKICFVLIKAFGDCYLNDQVPEDVLLQILRCAVAGDEDEHRNR